MIAKSRSADSTFGNTPEQEEGDQSDSLSFRGITRSVKGLASEVTEATENDSISRSAPAVEDTYSLENKFDRLAAAWRDKALLLSSSTEMSMIIEYQQIIGMGPGVVPLILRDLQREPDHWFWALRAITCENPVPIEAIGDIDAMSAAWVVWGADKGLI